MIAPRVYIFRAGAPVEAVKIGWSRWPENRLRTYRTWSPVPLELIATVPGGGELEMRLHAQFAHLHIHGEWFRAAPELDALIESIRSGVFDPASLPAGRRLGKRVVQPETIDAIRFSRRLGDLRALGVELPDDVQIASHTYGLSADEVARRRAIVREFVLRHDHLRGAASNAASERRKRFAQTARRRA